MIHSNFLAVINKDRGYLMDKQLIELIKQWREGAEDCADKFGYARGSGFAFREAADDLERVLIHIDAERRKDANAYLTYKGDLLHADDPKVLEHNDPSPLFLSPTIPEGMALVPIEKLEHAMQQAKTAADCIVGFSKAKPGGMCGWLDDACTTADIAASDIRAMLVAAQGECNAD